MQSNMLRVNESRTRIPQKGVNWRFCFAVFAAAFGSAFVNGYQTAVMNLPQEVSL